MLPEVSLFKTEKKDISECDFYLIILTRYTLK